jgi:hypothetical protein
VFLAVVEAKRLSALAREVKPHRTFGKRKISKKEPTHGRVARGAESRMAQHYHLAGVVISPSGKSVRVLPACLSSPICKNISVPA